MPKVSFRGLAMPESPIRKLVPYAEIAKRRGLEVLHLNIGQPDIETPLEARKAVNNYNESVFEYSHSAGNESYRKALAQYYNQISEGITFEHILVTTGGSEALSFAFTSCLNPDDEVIIPEPFYANYNSFAMASGINVVPIASSIKDGFALPSIDSFEEKITNKTKAILICNPGNPTGYLYSKSELQKLTQIVKKHDLFLFADEVYREFCYDDKEHYSLLNLSDIEENVVVIDSVSKRYSMCGVRIGAMISRNIQILQAALKLAQARLSPPLLGQIASEAALGVSSSYFEDVNKEYVQRRNVLVDGLNEIEGVFCPIPSGAFYAVAQLPVKDSEHFCQWILEHFEFEGSTVMMAPLAGFYSSPGMGQNEVRLAYVLEIEKLKKAIKCLREALEVYKLEFNTQ
ncbi:MAG: aspartate aminotransferase [Verrucomicrobia bacterium]|nr:aspartate aminotransferase [Verrucomicrobiota bacterium]